MWRDLSADFSALVIKGVLGHQYSTTDDELGFWEFSGLWLEAEQGSKFVAIAGGLFGPVFLGLPGERVVSIDGVPEDIRSWDPCPPDRPEDCKPDVSYIHDPLEHPLEGFCRTDEELYVPLGLALHGAFLYVDNDLTIWGGVEGLGGVVATGRIYVVGGNVSVQTDTPSGLAIGTLEGLYLGTFSEGSIFVTASASAGSTQLNVTDNGGFGPGDMIIICPGCPNEETNQVAGIGSLILATPLQFDHEPGELVVKISPTPSPKPMPTLTPSPTPTPSPTLALTPTAVSTATPTPTPTTTPSPTPTPAALAIVVGPTPTPTPSPTTAPAAPVVLPASGGGGAPPSTMGWPWAALCLSGATLLMLAGTAATVWSLRRWNQER